MQEELDQTEGKTALHVYCPPVHQFEGFLLTGKIPVKLPEPPGKSPHVTLVSIKKKKKIQRSLFFPLGS